VSVKERAVGGDAVTCLQAHPVAWNQVLSRKADEMAVAEHPRLRSGESLQPRQSGFGPLLLIETERRIEQQDEADRARFDRPRLRAFVNPDPEVKGECKQQDVDQGACELVEKTTPDGIRDPLRQRVRTKAGEPFGRFGCRESPRDGGHYLLFETRYAIYRDVTAGPRARAEDERQRVSPFHWPRVCWHLGSCCAARSDDRIEALPPLAGGAAKLA
jgi:hypothetical protein